MDEDAFRGFYDRTARALWGYLSRISGDRQVADDLLQECYYRLLKSTVVFESETHRRNYLYRIATNRSSPRVSRSAIYRHRKDRPMPSSAPTCAAPWDASSRASAPSSGSPTR